MRYQLFIITKTGCYPALTGTPPTEKAAELERLEEIIHTLRPGLGRHYLTATVRCDEQGIVIKEDERFMQGESEVLLNNCC